MRKDVKESEYLLLSVAICCYLFVQDETGSIKARIENPSAKVSASCRERWFEVGSPPHGKEIMSDFHFYSGGNHMSGALVVVNSDREIFELLRCTGDALNVLRQGLELDSKLFGFSYGL